MSVGWDITISNYQVFRSNQIRCGLGSFLLKDLGSNPGTVGPHEDIGKFPNCLNSIPSENFGLKKENEQHFF